MLKNLGTKIREIRKQKGLTLVEIAARTGVAQATLSRIETGAMIGTIESHEKIAEALGVGLADLFTGMVDPRHEQIEHNPATSVTLQDKNMQWELLTSGSSKKKITPLRLTLQPGAVSAPEQNNRGVEKFLYVLEGEMTVRIEKNEYRLREGETLYFEASLPHQISNISPKTARALITLSPSQI